MSIGTPQEIAAVEARIQELKDLLGSRHCDANGFGATAAATPELSEQRAGYRQQVQAEVSGAQERLAEMRKNRPDEFFGLSALVLGSITAITLLFAAGTKNAGLDGFVIFAGSAAAVTTVAVGASNTRWQGRKDLGLEVDK